MTNATKRMLIGSMAAAGLVALTTIVDLIVKFPFSGQRVMDALFLVSAGLVLYLAYSTYREQS